MVLAVAPLRRSPQAAGRQTFPRAGRDADGLEFAQALDAVRFSIGPAWAGPASRTPSRPSVAPLIHQTVTRGGRFADRVEAVRRTLPPGGPRPHLTWAPLRSSAAHKSTESFQAD